jgi:hypothetical protein
MHVREIVSMLLVVALSMIVLPPGTVIVYASIGQWSRAFFDNSGTARRRSPAPFAASRE